MIKIVNKASALLLQGLYRDGLEFFDIKAAAHILDDRNEASLRRVLSEMVKNGLLLRLRDGFYTIIPYHCEPAVISQIGILSLIIWWVKHLITLVITVP